MTSEREGSTVSVNKAILIGRLGADPEVKFLPSGSAVANFNIATDDSWTDKGTGQKQERTDWHRIVAYGRTAEIAGQYLKKGREVYIEGSIHTREWNDKDGNRRYTTEIKAQTLQFLAGGRQDGPTEMPMGDDGGAAAPASGARGGGGGGGYGGGAGAGAAGGGGYGGGARGGGGFSGGRGAPAGGGFDGGGREPPASGPPGGFTDDDIPF